MSEQRPRPTSLYIDGRSHRSHHTQTCPPRSFTHLLTANMRHLPNIIVTGTPGVGKSVTCDQLVSLAAASTPPIPLKVLSINAIAKCHGCHESYDGDLHTHVLNEDKLLDEIEKEIQDGEGGGHVIDYHACDLFPERWVDLVVVLRCERTEVLFDRLKERGYHEEKVQENMDAEIFGTVAEEAREGFTDPGVVVELSSEVAEDIEGNCERVVEWVRRWVRERGEEGEEEEVG